MVSTCCAAGCSKTHKDGVSLFRFPRERSRRERWIEQVRRGTRKTFNEPKEHTVLCSNHFEQDQFEIWPRIMESYGIIPKGKMVPKATAVPTLFLTKPNSRGNGKTSTESEASTGHAGGGSGTAETAGSGTDTADEAASPIWSSGDDTGPPTLQPKAGSALNVFEKESRVSFITVLGT